jgi:hypothetical protein
MVDLSVIPSCFELEPPALLDRWWLCFCDPINRPESKYAASDCDNGSCCEAVHKHVLAKSNPPTPPRRLNIIGRARYSVFSEATYKPGQQKTAGSTQNNTAHDILSSIAIAR